MLEHASAASSLRRGGGHAIRQDAEKETVLHKNRWLTGAGGPFRGSSPIQGSLLGARAGHPASEQQGGQER